jgi:Mor family transcriptional regulator
MHRDALDAAEHLAGDAQVWPRQMGEITETLAEELTRELGPAHARRLAGRLMARIAREFGGSTLYIPKCDALDRLLRNAAMWADWDGSVDGPRGVRAIAKRERISMVHAYRVLAFHRALHAREVQADLFAVTPVCGSTSAPAAGLPA